MDDGTKLGVVHYDIYQRAGRNFRAYLKMSNSLHHSWPRPDSSTYYAAAVLKFMGYNPYTARWFDEKNGENKLVLVPKESISKFNMLASPHHVALLKAWEVVHGPVDAPLTSTAGPSV